MPPATSKTPKPASIAAVSGAVVPALTALGGLVLLGEPLSMLTGGGVLRVAGGIWAFAGARS
ncbi:MAG: hypothetical protein AAFW64_04990, partial [Pseudomonadota bacterium]